MDIQSKRFNWVKTPSAWDTLQSWRARRSAMTQEFLDVTSAVNSSIASAQTNLSSGLASLAARAAITRAQEKLSATQQQFATTRNSINLSV